MTSVIEEYEEYQRPLGLTTIQIISYRLGEKHVCIVNNLDPGATICRVVGFSRLDALKRGLLQANELLSVTPFTTATPPVKVACLSLIEYTDGGEHACYSVETFLRMPIEFRTQSLMQNKLVFRDPEGEELPSGMALKYLSQACA
ncbi:MAG TPA: hypothetical protein VGL56_19075 [Fimbriimonadaceae bacterium]|jgi:hypothetical protein